MKSYCLCESKETLTAMRLGGIEGEIIVSDDQGKQSIERLLEDKSIALIMISENIHNKLNSFIMNKKLERMDTLIIQIPEPEGLQDKNYIMKYIRNSIGIKL
jgi:V/A-type H+-transporting ATPase subunit F